MKKYVLLFCFLLFGSAFLSAQTDSTKADSVKWTKSGSINVTFSNVGLENWAGGGQSAISLGGILDYKATRETNKSVWQNQFALNLGGAKIGGGSNNLFKKTDDQLILSTLYGYKLTTHWSLSAGLEFRSQLLPGYSYFRDGSGRERKGQLISDLFAPGFLNTNVIGATYKDTYFTLSFSPVAGKITFVLNDSLANARAFGVDPGKKVRLEVGFNFNGKVDVNIDKAKTMNFKSNLNLFSAYDPYFMQRIDVNWETLLTLKVNKYVTTGFGTQLIYDHDILIKQEDGTSKQAVQFRHALTVNFGVKF